MRAGDDVLPPLPCLAFEEPAVILGVVGVAVSMNASQLGNRQIYPVREGGEQLDGEKLREQHEVGTCCPVQQPAHVRANSSKLPTGLKTNWHAAIETLLGIAQSPKGDFMPKLDT